MFLGGQFCKLPNLNRAFPDFSSKLYMPGFQGYLLGQWVWLYREWWCHLNLFHVNWACYLYFFMGYVAMWLQKFLNMGGIRRWNLHKLLDLMGITKARGRTSDFQHGWMLQKKCGKLWQGLARWLFLSTDLVVREGNCDEPCCEDSKLSVGWGSDETPLATVNPSALKDYQPFTSRKKKARQLLENWTWLRCWKSKLPGWNAFRWTATKTPISFKKERQFEL